MMQVKLKRNRIDGAGARISSASYASAISLASEGEASMQGMRCRDEYIE